MSVLFCYDGPITVDSSGNFYGDSLNDEVFSRYLNISGNLTVAMRFRQIADHDQLKGLSKINLPSINFVEVPNCMTPQGLLLNTKKARKILKAEIEKADYIVVRVPSIIGNFAVSLANELNKPLLVEVVGCHWDALWNHSYMGKLIAPYLTLAMKKAVKNAPYSIYVTNKFLQSRYPTEGKWIGCSDVVLTEFNDETLKKRLERIERTNGKIIIGTLASVNIRYKGQQYIIKALGNLKRQGINNFEYQLVGGGDQNYLKSIAEKYGVSDQVKFMGLLPHDKVFDWLDTIDLYAQPSRQEGMPRALIEAMSRGLPAIGARTGGIPELLDERFIFSNSRTNIDEISKMLLKFDNHTMAEQAKRNYHESTQYAKKIVEEKRFTFIGEFKDQ